MTTTVVNRKYSTYDTYIGRGTIWGNPWSHREGTAAQFIVETREEAIQNYKTYILKRHDLLMRIPELKDKVLGCSCKPLECHGDFLAYLADLTEIELEKLINNALLGD